MITLTERTTDTLIQEFWKKEFNHNFKNGRIHSLFENFEPDGIDIIENGYIIFEHKREFLHFEEAKTQMKSYFETFRKHDKSNKLYCVLAFGTLSLIVKFYDENFKELTISDFKKLNFQTNIMIPKTLSKQQIHNLLVKSFNTQDPKEISNIFQIILMSFEHGDLLNEYETRNTINDSLFVNLLLENAKKEFGEGFNFQSFENVAYYEIFQICKQIYYVWKYNISELKEVYQQFKKYYDDGSLKNNVWTPPFIASFMNDFFINFYLDYISGLEKINIIDPCFGVSSLENKIFNDFSDSIYFEGFEIDKKIYRFGKLDFIMRGITGNIYCEDSMKHDFSGKHYNVCFINPPYTKNISGYEPFDFLLKMETYCDIIIAILPSRKIEEFKLHKKRLQIDIGDRIFKNKGTGSISILISDKLDFEFEFKKIDCKMDDCKWIPHRDEFEISQSSKNKLDKLLRLEFDIGNEQNEEDYKNMIMKITDKAKFIANIKPFDSPIRNMCLFYLLEQFNNDYINMEKFISDYNDISLMEVSKKHFFDYFEEVKVKKHKLHDREEGEYPMISASIKNNVICAYTKHCDINSDSYLLVIGKESGYCSINKGKFAITTHTMLFAPKQPININQVAICLNSQFKDICSFNRPMTIDRLKELTFEF